MPENKFTYHSIYNLGIWDSTLFGLDCKNLIKEIYNIKQNTPSVSKSNRGGYQTPDNINNNSLFYPLVNTLNNLLCEIKKTPNLKITHMWANISSFSNYNYPHRHSNTDNPNLFSGVVYLQVPKNSGNLVFLNPLSIDSECLIYSPKEKEVIFFPSILPHFVEPNLSQEDRISIAFNYG